MFLLSRILLFALSLRLAQSWTYSQYYVVTTISKDEKLSGTITTLTVSATGSPAPSATSTNITTTETAIGLGFNAIFTITVTNLYVQTNAPVCTTTGFADCCFTLANACSTKSAPATTTIQTSVYAAVTISNPPTCTQTSFLYTTSSLGLFQSSAVYGGFPFPTLYDQAVDTGSNGEAIFITTYVSTISIDLGGQAITTTRCDIWLKTDAVAGVTALLELSYLRECVDPRRYLCDSYGINSASTTCGTDWVSAYPGTQAINSLPSGATTSATMNPTDGSTGIPAPTQSKKPGGTVGGMNLLSQGLMMTALTAAGLVSLFLF